MRTQKERGVSEAEIAVHWQEEEYYHPSESFIRQANEKDRSIYRRFEMARFPGCFAEYAELLDWYRHWDRVLDTSDPPFWRWFAGGKLNVSHNCVDRHLADHRNKAALHFVPEPEDEPIQHVTFQELYVKVNEFAALLRDFAGLKRGDRVTLHMPMIPELPIVMLACARLGVIHSQVFSGYSAKSVADRAADAESNVLITADAYYRGGKLLDHKAHADTAVALAEKAGFKIDKVLIWQRHPGRYSSPTPLVEGRDFLVNELLKDFRGQRIAPEEMNADDPLFLMYTSGTTGQPKGCQHSTGGYLSYVAGTARSVLDIHPGDVYWCMADIGWITGHSYIVYGPLALGASVVVYEGLPAWPDAGRPWRIARDLGVNIFHTSPTAIRGLRRAGPDEPEKYDYHFKLMTTVGEAIEPEVWRWYYHVVGKDEAAIVDTWWQTETGGFLTSTMPALHPMKPGSTGPAMPGIYPVIYDDEGYVIPERSGRAGNICIANPWPGRMQTIWKNRERFVEAYYKRYCRNRESTDWRDWPYMTGDGATQESDGYYRILGRIDDIINVAGHRLGSKEIESAALTVAEAAEAAVVPVPDEIKGRVPEIYVSLKPGVEPTDELRRRLSDAVVSEIGAIARPRSVVIVPDMPKTRSGKIMRRILLALSCGEQVGDTTTLANPEIVEEIRKVVGRT
ncbi:acetate--CoA ligase [Geomesophilobacter sediminis]|uniref:Acetate--CoA ligase n=1 Tax=Geomesophilobacter sediminis TaxID=2798584 RepID=A0A8J7SAQ9_9BACT|nr:acetate--CoA ligase [Geomesophilobacter sediminis]MBJ6727630.1 acetate--CoA ligase [Geomesophilobacter sediminis]